MEPTPISQGTQQPAPIDPQEPPSGSPQPAPGNPPPAPGNPQQPAPGDPQQRPLANPQQPAPANTGLGGIILGGFGPGPAQGPNAPKATIPIAPPAQPNPVITAGGQQVTVLNPSAIVIGGTVVSANGPAATVGGQVISVGPNKGVIVGGASGGGNVGSSGGVNGEGNGGGNCSGNGGSTGGGYGSGPPAASVLLPPVEQANPVVTAGNGQLLTVINLSAIAIGGTMISAIAPAATIGGQVFSLDPST